MNEFIQNIGFSGSRLNWDTDISLLKEGESKHFLNTVIAQDEHMGVRTTCLGNQKTALYVGLPAADITVTTTSPSSTTKRFSFPVTSVGFVAEVEMLLNGNLKHLFLSGYGYATVADFRTFIIAEVRRHYENSLSSYGVSGTSVYFVFNVLDADQTTMQARERYGTATQPSGLSVIGSHYDNIANCTYYWTVGTTFLYAYFHDSNVIINIPLNKSFAVNKDTRVINAFLVGNAKKRMLYWCYSGITTYKINVYNHIIATSTAAVTTNPVLAKFLNVSAITEGYTSSAAKQNANSYYQVLLRSRYLDGERSVFSALSPLLYPRYYGENSVGVRGALANKIYSLSSTFTKDILKDAIEYAVKTGNGNWKLADVSVTSTADTTEAVTISGDESSSELAPSDINKLYDLVPQRHGTQCFVGSNRLLVADCLEGYDNATLTESHSVSYDSGYPSIPTIYLNVAFIGSDSPYEAIVTPLTISATEWRSHCIYLKTAWGNEYYAYVSDDYGLTQTELCDSLVEALTYQIANNYSGVDVGSIIPARVSSTVSIVANSASITCRYIVFRSYVKERTLKRGAKHYFGVAFYDNLGRCGGVNPLPEVTCNRSAPLNVPHDVTISVDSGVPSWATSAKLFYAGSSIIKSRQVVIKREDITIEQDTIKIFINNHVLESQIINPESQLSAYVFNPGDKFVFLGYYATDTVSVGGQTFTYSKFPYFSAAESCDVLGQDESSITIRKPSVDGLINEIDGSTYCLVEIYTPRVDSPLEYFETPYTLQVSSGAISDFSDVKYDHFINQTFWLTDGVPISAWIESESFSNYFESKTLGLGRVNFYSEGFRRLRRNSVRASNVYIPNTNINGLSTFDYANEVLLDESYGFITDMKVVGDVLKILQPRKLSSMYIGTEVGVDSNGNTVMFRSDQVLTEPRYGNTGYGSTHPESVIVHNSFLYFYDVINSAVIRDTPGGTFAISDNGMRAYFKYKTKQLVDSCGYSFKAIGVYDYKNEMYLLTFIDPYNSANNTTIGFHEPSENWCSFYSFLPEAYCGIPGKEILSFNGGHLYTHDSTTRNNFYGTQYNSEAWVVANQYPNDTKKFNTIYVNSNDVWAPSATDGVIVDSDHIAYQDGQNYTTHKGAMQSSLKEANFRIYNGEYRAEFLRDGTTNSSTFSVEDLINGRPLQGHTLIAKLINDNTAEVHLRSVRIGSQTVR